MDKEQNETQKTMYEQNENLHIQQAQYTPCRRNS